MPIRILFVDDEPQFQRLIQQRFRRELRNGIYEFLFAENGQIALNIIDQDPELDLVLTDINMPVMDGLTFLERLKATGSMLKTVVVSAYGDISNIRKAMNAGAFDFITKPIDFSDLRTTIKKTVAESQLIKKAQLAAELAQKNKELQQLDEMKSHFFTNISHELRTPLTVITGVVKQLQSAPEDNSHERLEMIRRNGDQLLDLINQILDLRKLESGKMELKLVQSDIVQLCSYLLESFKFLTEQKGIQLHFLSEEDEVLMDQDPEKLTRILTNLIINAIKHTDEGGNIYLMLSHKAPNLLKIKIKDTGRGIAAEQIPFVFNRFYQSPDQPSGGTGVGLSLVKELVALMEGEISVESKLEKGSIFTLTLPIRNEAPIQASNDVSHQIEVKAKTYQAAELELTKASDESLQHLLIVEDNHDVLQYLITCLDTQYKITVARDGEEGVAKALEQIPDIIISDVMMPKKNGFELCSLLKQDQQTSHIPVVLLTAKADTESRISGLNRGADAYLAKPFDQEELMAVLKQILQQRAALRARYAQLDLTETVPEQVFDYDFSTEDNFIKKAIALVEENINDTTFTVPVFCRQMGMSYSVIHRKLAALTSKSPALFIRTIRLHQAKKMLSDLEKNITEIAYDVGFTDPKYFSRAFSEEFSAPPSSFR